MKKLILGTFFPQVSKFMALQGPTERCPFRGTFRRMFRYFWAVPCSVIQWGNREGKTEPLFLAFFDIFPHCVVAFYRLGGGKVLTLESLPTLLYYNTESRISAYFRKTQEKS